MKWKKKEWVILKVYFYWWSNKKLQSLLKIVTLFSCYSEVIVELTFVFFTQFADYYY